MNTTTISALNYTLNKLEQRNDKQRVYDSVIAMQVAEVVVANSGDVVLRKEARYTLQNLADE